MTKQRQTANCHGFIGTMATLAWSALEWTGCVPFEVWLPGHFLLVLIGFGVWLRGGCRTPWGNVRLVSDKRSGEVTPSFRP